MTIRRHSLSRDQTGCFRPHVGYVRDEKGRRKFRFNLGRDERLAAARYARLQTLYEEQCRQMLFEPGDPHHWDAEPLQIAKAIAAGKGHTVSFDPRFPDRTYLWQVNQVKAELPSAQIAADPEAMTRAVQDNQAFVAEQIALLYSHLQKIGAVTPGMGIPSENLAPGTLHEALAAYRRMVQRDGLKTAP